MSTPKLLIEFDRITVLKGQYQKVLNDVSLKIYAGENVVILGPNGAGKSSLIKTITREYYPAETDMAYTYKIWGQQRWDVFELRHYLGIVSNDLQYRYAREITGLEVILSGFFSSIGLFQEHVTPAMQKKARAIMTFLEIEHLKDKYINVMSSGEARRFLIGRALVHDPKALILDEPTNSLDVHAVYKFSDTLRKIAKAGTSIILVTHHVEDIIPEIGRVILMKDGRIDQDGPKAKVLTDTHISRVFDAKVRLHKDAGYYYTVRKV